MFTEIYLDNDTGQPLVSGEYDSTNWTEGTILNEVYSETQKIGATYEVRSCKEMTKLIDEQETPILKVIVMRIS